MNTFGLRPAPPSIFFCKGQFRPRPCACTASKGRIDRPVYPIKDPCKALGKAQRLAGVLGYKKRLGSCEPCVLVMGCWCSAVFIRNAGASMGALISSADPAALQIPSRREWTLAKLKTPSG